MKNNLCFRVLKDNIIGSETFSEASREELRVLVAIISSDGMVESEEHLAAAAGVSRARTVAAIALWEESGIISRSISRTVTEEYADCYNDSDIEESDSASVACDIRNENLAAMLTECQALMQKGALSTQQIKAICVLNTEYALSPEYITTLAAHIAAKGKLTATRLRDEAKRLCGKGIDTLEALEQYIIDRENETADEWEMRRVVGIYNRNLSDTERAYFKKWSGELGYSVNIVSFAFDVTVLATGKLSFQFMDKLLSSWHAEGCKTLEECRAAHSAHKAQGESTSQPKSTRTRSRTEAPKPRYGDFDVDEAFKHALSRSFGDDED